jgi:hypothetical protein
VRAGPLVRPNDSLSLGRITAREGTNKYPGQWYLYLDVLCANPLPGQQNADNVVYTRQGFAQCPAGTRVISAGGGGGLSDSGPYYLRARMPLNIGTGSYATMTDPSAECRHGCPGDLRELTWRAVSAAGTRWPR